MIKTIGSLCSGIEAASSAWGDFFKFEWFSEIAPFPSKVLDAKYPMVKNLGDMTFVPNKICCHEITAPDMICGGTPCQPFSLAGWTKGLDDVRGLLSFKFIETIETNDLVRSEKNLPPTIVFWENVEGVLTDKTNAFGYLVSSLAGIDDEITKKRWPSAGVVKGPKRNVAWRVLDAKYFGVPQQRRRVYVLAGGKDFNPESILFEWHTKNFDMYPTHDLTFEKDGHKFQIFREYTDCLYAAYATKWNGNAAAYNGSLFVVQDGRLRRFSPLECERLMGLPDDYTLVSGATRTNRYQAIGNSWAVPVVKWIGRRLVEGVPGGVVLPGGENIYEFDGMGINCSFQPNNCIFTPMQNIVCANAPEEVYISPVGCHGIIRRKRERGISINPQLEEVLIRISSQMPPEEIEKKSRVQKRSKRFDQMCV